MKDIIIIIIFIAFVSPLLYVMWNISKSKPIELTRGDVINLNIASKTRDQQSLTNTTMLEDYLYGTISNLKPLKGLTDESKMKSVVKNTWVTNPDLSDTFKKVDHNMRLTVLRLITDHKYNGEGTIYDYVLNGVIDEGEGIRRIARNET